MQEYGDTYPPTVAVVGDLELVNDEGSRSGLGSGIYGPAMGWQLVGYQSREGAYEGLTLYLHVSQSENSWPVANLEGIIFEGSAPMMVEAVQVPAE